MSVQRDRASGADHALRQVRGSADRHDACRPGVGRGDVAQSRPRLRADRRLHRLPGPLVVERCPGARPGEPATIAAEARRGAIRRPASLAAWALIWRATVADRPALAGLMFVIAVVLVSVAAPVFSPYDPTVPVSGSRLAPPFTPGHGRRAHRRRR
ncbi:MAG: hypothetical protein E6H03_01610 [Bacillati bacterium ANGP1]|uniref:Oligopeptide transport permease C-like N-terminal domain-containing protein n=1 Tax=Candidatus Segetimicrobium genomatis TaxID=2569760 RepID=A0A537JM72_9BACT|nr:MAG: hypothetical protein E6H03_01610 [Terrabacteria group bacterium ANGP1]